MKNILLTRENFKILVFHRDKHKCVVCGEDAIDAHHILDRSLFDDGGYYIDNGVSLCAIHHEKAESTEISCSELRRLSKIENIVLPDALGITEFIIDYDKWGNPILKNGNRLKGYLFNEKSKIFPKNILDLFEKDTNIIVDKYPRTYHLPFSLGTTSDDRISKSIGKALQGKRIMTEKLDGENTCLSEYGLYARSRTSPTKNPWTQWLKPKWDLIKKILRILK